MLFIHSGMYIRHGASTNILVLKSNLSTFLKCLKVLLNIFLRKVLVLMLEYLLIKCLLSRNATTTKQDIYMYLHYNYKHMYMYFKYHDTVLYMYRDIFGSNSKYLKLFQVTGFRIMVFVNSIVITYHILSNWCCPYWNF